MKIDIYIRQRDLDAFDRFKAAGGNASALFAKALRDRDTGPRAGCQWCGYVHPLVDLEHYTCEKCNREADAAIAEAGRQ